MRPCQSHCLAACLLPLLLVPGLLDAEMSDWSLRYQASLSSETLRPDVSGETRRLDSQLASLHIQESLGPGLYGGIQFGLPSIRWHAPDESDSPRMGGWLLGFSLGGRHPQGSQLGLAWDVEYLWSEVNGSLAEDRELRLTLRESRARLGLSWQGRHAQLLAGVAWRDWDGEERIDTEQTGPTRRLGWSPDPHGFIEGRLALDRDGWMTVGWMDTADEGQLLLGFGRGF